MKAARMPKLPNQAKAKAKPNLPEANTKQAAAAMGPIKAPCCTREAEKERPDPTAVPVKLDLKQENNNRPSSTADNIHGVHPSPSLECSQPYRSQNSRTSKAERVLGLTSQDLETEKRLERSNRQTPTISIDSPRTPTFSRHPPSAAQSSDAHQRCHSHSQKSASKSRSGVLRLPAERPGVTQVASSSDLKLVGDGSEVESDADQSSVGDEGSARSSPYPKKKSTERRGRDRFKKILRPLTRSKSAGAGDRVPAYALFLRHQPHPQPSVVNRSTDNVMRNSTDCTESEDETTDGASSHKVPTTHKHKKDRFAFFRRSGEGQSGHSPNALLPSTETLQGWTKSFDKLLADSYGLKLFREFLRREFSDENVEFWIECEKYRHLTSEKHRSTEAKRIFREYVAVQAPNEINLDSKTREATEANLSRADTKVFESAQKRIEALMEKDSYPRFLQSDLFQRLLHQRHAADNSLKFT